jgi:hypothetical protein
LSGKRHSFGTNTFAIEATDGITNQKARPIRKHELLAAYEYEPNQIALLLGDDTEWNATVKRLEKTASVHTWEPVLAALYAAEIEQATEATTELCQAEMEATDANQSHHHTDSKVLYSHAETEEPLPKKTEQCGNDTRVFNLTHKVINRWTTLPLPTTETWTRATDQDPDL